MPSVLLPRTFLSARQASHFSVSFFLLSSVSLTWQLSVAAPRYGYLFLLLPPHEVLGSVVGLASPQASKDRVALRSGRGGGTVPLGVSDRDMAVPGTESERGHLLQTPSSPLQLPEAGGPGEIRTIRYIRDGWFQAPVAAGTPSMVLREPLWESSEFS